MSNRIEEVNLTTQRIITVLGEMEAIASKDKPTAQDEMRHRALLAEFSALRSGITPTELARARTSALARELGHPDPFSTKGSAELRAAWYRFVGGSEERTSFTATSEYGNVVGLTYSNAAGYFVPPEYDKHLRASLPAVDELLAEGNCNVIETESGAAMCSPAIDDVSGSPLVAVASQRLGEAVQSGDGYVRAASCQWGTAPTYRSGVVYCSTELDQDSAFALLPLLETAFNRRHALGFGAEAINGSGVEASGDIAGVPYGLLTACAQLASATNITAQYALTANFINDLVKLFFTLPMQYRRGAKFFMSSTMALYVGQALENVLRPVGTPYGLDKLFNRDIVICEHMPAVGNSPAIQVNAAIIFAHPDYLLVRHVKNASGIKRFTQNPNAIEAGLIGFQSYFRADARPILFDSVQPPVASLNVIG
jgi:HK97 family phage major capsid protein